jgi:LAO/AO transport system kinase
VGPGARRVGVTGPPGAGKSTLLAALAATYRGLGERVGVVAVDPTSPFSGGALLGDRIRMNDLATDPGIFIRSMATRGSLGGLATTTRVVLDLLDAFGFERVLVETVGVGQTELDIMRNVDTTVVVLVPEAGDAIQTMKAGLFEIADIFAVNKADRPGADKLVAELRTMVQLRSEESCWQVPVVATEAINDIGIGELYEQIEKHRRALEETGRLSQRRQEQRRREFVEIVERRVSEELLNMVERDEELGRHMAMVETGEVDPYSAADEILRPRTLLASWSRRPAGRRSKGYTSTG